jgi:LacI family transcriptional regulator
MVEKKQRVASSSSPTISDVAHKAGVSRTAVSFVLNEENGQRNRNISEATRAKVLQAIQELDFHPHPLARTLSTGKSNEIVGMVDAALTLFALELINSFQLHAVAHGFTVVMYSSQGMTVEQRQACYRTIFARHPLALVLSSPRFTEEDLALARQMGVRHLLFVGFEPIQAEEIRSFVFLSEAVGRLAAEHLIARGHRHLALVRPDDPVQAVPFAQRLAGMHAVMAKHPDVTLDILPLHLSTSSARELVETVFQQAQHPTAVYAFHDEYALFLMGALARRGIRVPEEVAVMGTDNIPLGEASWPALTTISFDATDIGKRLFDLFHTRVQGRPVPEDLSRPPVPSLILREST